jgi:Kef-type K+ transport system membrane component KefB
MTNYIILVLCIVVILSYIFDISSSYSKIPGVIFLIILGIALQYVVKGLQIQVPNLQPVLPVIGTLGLIMIVMEASLELKLEKKKKGLIIRSISSALLLFAVFTAAMTYVLVEFFSMPLTASLINSIPVGIISSSVAISSSVNLNPPDKEFIVYESAFSDIIGIIVFDFILLSHDRLGQGVVDLGLRSILTIGIALVTTLILAILLHKITYHINYVIIMTSIVMVYIIAKIFHLPALLLVLIFGLVLSNNRFFRNRIAEKYIDFQKFSNDIRSFKVILTEFTFLIRSFFFIMFGFYAKVEGLFDKQNLITGAAITAAIFLLRLLFFNQVIRIRLVPLLFFAPRGLITILLFITIPESFRISIINEEVITIVILFTIFILMIGNMLSGKARQPKDEKSADPEIIPGQ